MAYTTGNYLNKTLVDVFHSLVADDPDRNILHFIQDGGSEVSRLTRAGLDTRARAIAAVLRGRVPAGGRALLIHPAGLEFFEAFLGCVYAGVVAVPVAPPEARRINVDLDRIRRIAQDCAAELMLTSAAGVDRISARMSPGAPGRAADFLAGLDAGGLPPLLVSDDIPDSAGAGYREVRPTPTSLLHLQYSSGSTGAPKGVMLTHGAVVAQVGFLSRVTYSTERSRAVNWLPNFHDMGLMANLLAPLCVGGEAWSMAPESFIKRPVKWLRAISEYRAEITAAPNFAYDLCVRRITPEQRGDLDLTSWRVAISGAETVRAQTIDNFVAAFAGSGFRRSTFFPSFGLAEATLMVTGGSPGDAPDVRRADPDALLAGDYVPAFGERASTLVASGRIHPEMTVAIVSPGERRPLPDGLVGEICAAGDSLGSGYFNNPVATADVFGLRLAGHGDRSFLRTGDLGFVMDGQLFVTGRLKDMVILDGRNHYPQDIEQTAERSHPAMRPGRCIAFGVDSGDRERLVLVCELDRRGAPRSPGAASSLQAAVAATVRRAVQAEHGLDIHHLVFVRTGRLPMTGSGKPRRLTCRAQYLAGEFVADVLEGAGALSRPVAEGARR